MKGNMRERDRQKQREGGREGGEKERERERIIDTEKNSWDGISSREGTSLLL